MITISKYDIEYFLLILIIIFANITGIIELIGGSIFAEGIIIILVFILTLLLLIQKIKYDIFDYGMIFIALYSIVITLINISFYDVELSSLIGVYYYTIPCLIFLNKDNILFKLKQEYYFKLFLIMLFFNSIFAIYQFINPNPIIPLDSYRATGLMKSTLNYSGIIGAMFFPLLFIIKNSNYFNKILFGIIVIGGIFSLSRGLFANILLALVISPISLLIVNKKINKKCTKGVLTIILIIITVFILYNLFKDYDFFQRLDRLLHIFDYKTDNANLGRLKFWKNFIVYFTQNPLGYGVGQIASGTSFVNNSVNFESYILDTFYSIGVVGVLYFLIPVIWIYDKLKRVPVNYLQYMHMFIVGVLIQNAVQPSMLTPTTLIITWLNIIFFTNIIRFIANKQLCKGKNGKYEKIKIVNNNNTSSNS